MLTNEHTGLANPESPSTSEDLGPLLARVLQLEQEARHAALLHRDHVIGLQAELQTALDERDTLRARFDRSQQTVVRLRTLLKEARTRIKSLVTKNAALNRSTVAQKKRIIELKHEVSAIRSSRTWKIGRLFVAPLSRRSR
jgi:predicted  nucleic acid-binding Zn-ribbon protein